MSVFVGREQDLETLGGYWQDALQGKGGVVFITGEAGIGKTTFINAFKARYLDAAPPAQGRKAPDIRFAEAKCSEIIGKGESYAPFIEIISRFVADDKAFGSNKLAEVVREIGADWFELVPVIGKALALIGKTVFKWQNTDDVRQLADRKGNKEKLVQQYVQILKTMSAKHPLVLFVDDLHWADDSSIYLLFQLAREIAAHRILLLGTYRPTDIQAARGEKPHPLKDALSEMHRFGVCKEIKLGYFTPDHIRRYLDAVFPQNRLDAAFVADLRDLTEGNPLFVTEQVKLLQEIGKIARVDGAWQLRGALRDADMPIPTSVEKTIEKRFERLKEELQETLQYASVNGEQFDSAVLAQMLGRAELDILKQLQTLDRVYEFVREQKTVPFDFAQGTAESLVERSRNEQRPMTRGSIYQFIHSLVQKALYGTLSDGLKVKLHAKAAEIIEVLYPEQREAFAEELAAHWERGREYVKAAPYALLAARKANRQAGYKEAHAHAQRGLDLLAQAGYAQAEKRVKAKQGSEADQAMVKQYIELLLEHAAAEEALGEAKNSIEHAENAAKLAEMVEDQEFQGEVFYQTGNLLSLNGTTNSEQLINYLEKALTINIATQAYENVVKVLEIMRYPYETLNKGDDFIIHGQKVIRLNQEAQKAHLNMVVLKFVGIMFNSQGKHQQAYQSFLEGLEIAMAIKNPEMEMELLQYLVLYAVRLNDFSKASEHYEQAKTIVNATNDLESNINMFQNLGKMAGNLAKSDEAFAHYQIAKEAAHNKGDLEAEIKILADIRYRLRAIGRFDEAIQYGMECLKICQKLGLVREILEALDGLALLFKNQGTHDKAVDIRQQAIALATQYKREGTIAWFLFQGHTELRLMGKFREAIEALNGALRIYRQMKKVNWEVVCLTNLAIRHLLIGHISESRALINQAILLNQTTQWENNLIIVPMCHSFILMGIGAYKEAYTMLESVIEVGMRRGIGIYEDLHEHLLNSVRLYLAFDNTEKALERLSWTEDFLKRFFIQEGIAMLKDAYAQVYLAQGDFEKAETSLNEAIALFQQMNSYRRGEAYLTRGALRLAQQQPAAALQCATDARAIFEPLEYYRRGEAILLEAQALFALRDFPAAQQRLKDAAAEFKRLQQPHHLAAAQLLHGQMLAAAGQKEKGLQAIAKAKAKFAESGLKRLQKEAEKRILEITA